jgi:hypothetical protein
MSHWEEISAAFLFNTENSSLLSLVSNHTVRDDEARAAATACETPRWRRYACDGEDSGEE